MIRSRSSRISSSAEVLVRTLAATLALVAVSGPAAAGSRHQDRAFLTRPYPIEAAPSFPCGLFHWVDSLAGTSGGKTIPAHRADYRRRFGGISDEDQAQLAEFVTARAGYRGARASALLGVFCSAATVDDAMTTARGGLSAELSSRLEHALAHFRAKYELVWNRGAVPEAFLARARRDPGRDRLEALLGKIVNFYGVDPLKAPPPRLALVPVPGGFGTHAEAIGGVLVLEIREGDGLADEASVLVHETSHFLWGLVPPDRQRRLAEVAAERGGDGTRIFGLFREAIPTALGQGVADRSFRPAAFSLALPWYHVKDVDDCAKRIVALVGAALDQGSTLDETFVRRAIESASGAR